MRPYLSNYYNTLSTRRQERVSSILEEARASREQLDALVAKLKEADAISRVVLAKDEPNYLIDGYVTSTNLNNIASRVTELYSISNAVSLLLNSHTQLLATDVKAIEDELLAMEKMTQNFAFLLADNQAYDFAYLEPFSDELGRDMELGSIPDRAQIRFGPSDTATVNTDEGVLALPNNLVGGHSLTGRIVKGNATAFKLYDSGIENALSVGTSLGWKMTVATAGPVDAPLPEAYGRPGAQVVLEFELTDAAPCSELKLVPYADMSSELVQVTLYPADDYAQETDLLPNPVRFERSLTLHFPMQSVRRFRVVLNQPTYTRRNQQERIKESRQLDLIHEINERRRTEYVGRDYTTRKLERSLQDRTTGKKGFSTSLPISSLTPSRGPMRMENLVSIQRYGNNAMWSKVSGRAKVLNEVLWAKANNVVSLELTRNSGSPLDASQRLLGGGGASQVIADTATEVAVENGHDYYYNLGLHYVAIGVDSPGFKGVFVSKPLPSTGDIGEVRIKTSEDNYTLAVTDRHSPHLTSVEYSVSNKSNPENEVDWVPVLPVGATFIEGERLFVDGDGKGYFRFPALSGQLLKIYRNGYLVNLENLQMLLGNPGSIHGVKFSIDTINQEDIFTCDYQPVGDPTTVSFAAHGFDVPPLVFAADLSGGAGERFLATQERNTVKLLSQPYIDPVQAAAGGYQPITVMLDSGETAINVTDYKTQKSSPLPDEGYYYIHTGDMLLFNRPISTPFRVYYQYLQNNVRVRTVLRCNVKDFVSPKVDFVHVKAKTRNSDVRTGV